MLNLLNQLCCIFCTQPVTPEQEAGAAAFILVALFIGVPVLCLSALFNLGMDRLCKKWDKEDKENKEN